MELRLSRQTSLLITLLLCGCGADPPESHSVSPDSGVADSSTDETLGGEAPPMYYTMSDYKAGSSSDDPNSCRITIHNSPVGEFNFAVESPYILPKEGFVKTVAVPDTSYTAKFSLVSRPGAVVQLIHWNDELVPSESMVSEKRSGSSAGDVGPTFRNVADNIDAYKGQRILWKGQSMSGEYAAGSTTLTNVVLAPGYWSSVELTAPLENAIPAETDFWFEGSVSSKLAMSFTAPGGASAGGTVIIVVKDAKISRSKP